MPSYRIEDHGGMFAVYVDAPTATEPLSRHASERAALAQRKRFEEADVRRKR